MKQKAPNSFKVLQMTLQGESEATIAEKRNKTPGTIRKQISNIYEKFGLTGDAKREQLIQLFLQYAPEYVDLEKLEAQGHQINLPHPLTQLQGALSVDDSRYLLRSGDEIVRQALTIAYQMDNRSLIRVRGPKGVGKSSLLRRLEQFLMTHQHHQVGFVNLAGGAFEPEAFDNFGLLMQRFTQAVFRAFKPSLDVTALATLPDLDTYWQQDLAPAIKCSEYLNDYLFPQVSDPKTLMIDGIDRVLGHNTWEGFSGFLRAFFEEKMKTVRLHQQITAPHLVIAYSTEPYAKYEVLGGSPLANVGLAVDLEEFNADQILELAQRYHLDWDESILWGV